MDFSDITQFTEIRNFIETSPEPLRGYIKFLESRFDVQAQQINVQAQQIDDLGSRIKELEGRLAKNSSNSGKPPSSDGQNKQNKTRSQRGKSGKKPGGQPGRTGKNLQQVSNPDHIIEHAQTSCDHCGSSLEGITGECLEARQVFDIPEPKMEVTEHRIVGKTCPCCAEKNRGAFPDNVTAYTQYGDRARAFMVYLNNQHMVPVERVSQLFTDLYGAKVSPGTITKAGLRAYRNLEAFEADLKVALLAALILHFDETGVRCKKKNHWIHVGSSLFATLYHAHPKRGREGMVAGGIIELFRGTGVHDGLKTYFSFENMRHALCNGHHLRELDFVHKQEGEPWAQKMKKQLLSMKKQVAEDYQLHEVPEERLESWRREYASIVLEGLTFHAKLAPLPKGKRGRRKQRPGKNLLDRLSDGMEYVLRFLSNPLVPFTNNLAEQDLRMIKVQQKVSGCFRDESGVTQFCRIRSCISTARKQGWSILHTLLQAIRGEQLPVIIRS